MNSLIQSLFASLRSQITTRPVLSGFDVVSLARPSVRIATQRVPNARIGVGESRIGGLPDVPLGFEWPRWLPTEPRDDKFGQPWRPNVAAPLGFIAQFDLSETPRVEPLERWTAEEQTQAEGETFILDRVFLNLPSPPFTEEV